MTPKDEEILERIKAAWGIAVGILSLAATALLVYLVHFEVFQ
jgi:hypothetical protein